MSMFHSAFWVIWGFLGLFRLLFFGVFLWFQAFFPICEICCSLSLRSVRVLSTLPTCEIGKGTCFCPAAPLGTLALSCPKPH